MLLVDFVRHIGDRWRFMVLSLEKCVNENRGMHFPCFNKSFELKGQVALLHH